MNSLLKNEKLCGIYIYNREGGKRKKHRVLLEHFDEVRNETAIPPIVSKELFNKVQAIMAQRNVCCPHQNKNPEYILTGFVQCKSCGSSMSGMANSGGRGRKRMRHYTCPNHSKRQGKTCTTKKINADYLETAVKNIIADKVNAYLSTPNTQKSVFDLLKQSKLEEVKATKKHIDGLEIKINGLIDRAANPKTPPAVAERYEKQANEAIQLQNGHKANLVELNTILSRIDEIETQFTAKSAQLTVADLFTSYELARELVGVFIEKIIVDDKSDEIEIVFKN